MSLEISEALVKTIDTTNLVGGKLLILENSKKIQEKDFMNVLNSQVAEVLIEHFPPTKDPSGYLLGDAVLRYDSAIGHMICGKPSPNPILEEERRKRALGEGSKMKLLLSYIRARSSRTDKGRFPEMTYLKEMWLAKKPADKRSKTSSPTPSVTSDRSDLTSTTLVLGEETGTSPGCLACICFFFKIGVFVLTGFHMWDEFQGQLDQNPTQKCIACPPLQANGCVLASSF